MTIICPCCGEQIKITVTADVSDDHIAGVGKMAVQGNYEFGIVPDGYDEKQNTDHYNSDMKGGETENGK